MTLSPEATFLQASRPLGMCRIRELPMKPHPTLRRFPVSAERAPAPSPNSQRHRSRHHHVGDLRFAAFMMVIFAIAMLLTFQSHASTAASPMLRAEQRIQCASTGSGEAKDRTSGLPTTSVASTQKVGALTDPGGAKRPIVVPAHIDTDACRVFPSATAAQLRGRP